jgi:type IV secretion system protein VirB9
MNRGIQISILRNKNRKAARITCQFLAVIACFVLLPLAAHAQVGGSPFDSGFTALQTLFISSNLNLITDKGNIYSFTLQDVSGTSQVPDLKVLIVPADRSSIVASSGPPQYVPAAQLEQSREQLAALQTHVAQAVDEYKSSYQTQLKFDYVFHANEAPFDIQSIYHDDKFTYIKTNAPEKFSVYEMKDGKPNLISYDLREGTYIIPKVMDSGYVELGKKRMEFSRKG